MTESSTTSDILRQSDIRFYEEALAEFRKTILKARIAGGLLVAGALAEGSGASYAINMGVNNGNIDRHPNAFGVTLSISIIGFLVFAGGSIFNFLKASAENNDSQGTRDILTRLRAGENIPGLHSGGGAD